MFTVIRQFLKRVRLYEWIAFVTGFVLMAFELAASRILAPTIGTSIYVWTSVIGVMIAALAIGYACGGWLADHRGVKQDVGWLLLIASLSIITTCLFYDPVLASAVAVTHDPRLQGVIASAILFAPASFVMGTISPYLAKLRVRSLGTTGRSVATLSALNSLGGISGTFSAGFIFFNYIGSRETLALLAAIVLACSWQCMAAARHWRIRTTLTVFLCSAIALQFAGVTQAGTVASIDTPTSHYKVVDLQQMFGTLRVLIMGPGGYQSGVYTNGPKELAFDYTHKIADVVAAAPQKDRILILGGGAFTLPEYFGRMYPNSQIDVVEIDPQLPAIAKKYFRYEPTANIHTISQDGRTYVRDTQHMYDVVIVDAYNDSSVPFSMATREFASSLARIVRPGGIVTANLIASANADCMPLLSGIHSSYTAAFSHAALYPLTDANITAVQNIITLYSNSPLRWAENIPGASQTNITGSQKLTDNFAPTERLVQQCGA